MESVQGPGDQRLIQVLDSLADTQLALDRERVRREEVESLFDAMLRSMSDALLLVDARGLVLRANQAAGRMLDRAGDELVGRPLETLVPDTVPATPWQLLEAGGSLDAETVLHGPGGAATPVSLSCAVVRDVHDRVIGAVYAARDLSETQRLLGELEEAGARWRLLAEVGGLLTAEVDPRSALPEALRHVSGAIECEVAAVLVEGGVIEETVVPEGAATLAAELADLAPGPLAAGTALARVLSEPQTLHASSMTANFPLLRPDGTGQVRSAAVVPLVARGDILGVVVLAAEQPAGVGERAVDIAEQIARTVGLMLANARLRESLAQAQAAEEVARSRQEILAGLSHDMKTPLTAIEGFTQVLQDDGLSADSRAGVVRSLDANAQRLRRLVLQFLDYIRLEAGHGLEVQPRPTAVPDVVARVAASAPDSDRLVVEVPPDLPAAHADPDRLDQILANLISNAFKYSPPDEPVTIAARAAGERVEISVIDRGPGIDPVQQVGIFDKYRRAGGGAGREGTGLGLYMSRVLVEAQGGRISVASRLGRGSRFTVVLPVRPAGGEGDGSRPGRG
jgi:PAS domain S-box-containing protein